MTSSIYRLVLLIRPAADDPDHYEFEPHVSDVSYVSLAGALERIIMAGDRLLEARIEVWAEEPVRGLGLPRGTPRLASMKDMKWSTPMHIPNPEKDES